MSECPDEIHGGKYRWVCVGHTSTGACIRKPFPLRDLTSTDN